MKLGQTPRLESPRISISIPSVILRLTPRLPQSGLEIRSCRLKAPRSHQVTRAEEKTGFGTPKKKMTNSASRPILPKCS